MGRDFIPWNGIWFSKYLLFVYIHVHQHIQESLRNILHISWIYEVMYGTIWRGHIFSSKCQFFGEIVVLTLWTNNFDGPTNIQSLANRARSQCLVFVVKISAPVLLKIVDNWLTALPLAAVCPKADWQQRDRLAVKIGINLGCSPVVLATPPRHRCPVVITSHTAVTWSTGHLVTWSLVPGHLVPWSVAVETTTHCVEGAMVNSADSKLEFNEH